ncbi:MAG: S8 family peptidase [candidate division Zixibacteria bacterium]|nr:S8 family peptidase [candidate division Zixibacteria bacterium]
MKLVCNTLLKKLHGCKAVIFGVTILVFLVLAQNAESQQKLSPELSVIISNSSSSELHKVWIYFELPDSLLEKVKLSEKSLRRRSKVFGLNDSQNRFDFRPSDKVLQEITSTGVPIRRVSRWFKAVSVEASASQILQLVRLAFVSKVDLVKTLSTPLPVVEVSQQRNIPAQRSALLPYGLSLFQNSFINAVKLHEAGLSGKGVLIALFDTGFDTAHVAFDSTSIIVSYDFINNDDDVSGADCPTGVQQSFHGTLTLGVMGAYLPGTLIGVAYGADYALAKTEITCTDINGNDEFKVEEDNWIAAAEWADSIGADIISSSLGYTTFDDGGSYTQSQLDGNTALITIAADFAAAMNILVVNSAGNSRSPQPGAWNTISFPADGDSVLTVGAATSDSSLAPFSSPGPTADGRIKPDISAIGVNVFTVRQNGGTISATGTSLSTPLVAGGAALALEHDSTMTANEALKLIQQTASSSQNPDNDFGYGLYNAARAADIIKIDQSGIFQVTTGQTRIIAISASGRSLATPAISLAGTVPAGISLTDNSDGTASLSVTGSAALGVQTILNIVADVGYYADTARLVIEVQSLTSDFIRAAPNPFTSSVRFLISSAAGNWQSLTIYTAAGERIWEKVNNFAVSADTTINWDGRNAQGKATSAGVYILHFRASNAERRLKLLKTN